MPEKDIARLQRVQNYFARMFGRNAQNIYAP